MSLWSQTRDGQSTFVVVTGEPGIGKSRLVEEALRQAVAKGARRYAVWCDPRFSHSPFYPVIEFVEQMLAADSDGAPWPAKVMGEDIHYLEALVGCGETNETFAAESPETRRAKTMRALTGLFQSLGDAGPAICVWEDVHAADPSTLELFERLSDAVSVAPILHLAASRPSDALDWSGRPQMTHIEVLPLSDTDTKALAVATAREVVLSPPVLEQIVATTDGVPLFVEEITKMLLESDWLQEKDGQRVFIQDHVSAVIPMTLQDSLMARLDRLPAGRALAQYAATIGREFDDILLGAVVDVRIHKEGIAQLMNAGLIQRIDVTPTRFRFKHALVSDTAYQSLLKSERRVYHAQIADAIERVTPEIAEAQPEIVAHHLTEGGRVERAVPLWQAAGERAMSRSANREALHHLETGLNLLSAMPHTAARESQELGLRMAIGPVLITLKGNAAPEVEMSYERARQLCDGLLDDARAFAATFGLRSYYLTQADLAKSHTLGERLLDIATINDDPDEKLEAHVALSNTFFFYGDFPAVQTHVDAGIALYRESQHANHVQTYGLDPGVICLSRAAQALWHRGFPDRAVEVMGDAISLAERLQHPFTTAYLYDNAAVLYQWRREGNRARSWAESAVALATQYNFPFFRAWGLMQAGHALVELGHIDDGLANMDEGMAVADSIGVLLMQPWFLATRGEACLRTQQLTDGLKYVADAIAVVEHTGAVYAVPALFWLKGELLMLEEGLVNFAEAEQSLLQAKQIAAQHGSRAFELRAAVALCRICESQGKSDEATNWLTEVYGSFTEGFTTKDLQEAEDLLNERS
jgi:predicted ATPase